MADADVARRIIARTTILPSEGAFKLGEMAATKIIESLAEHGYVIARAENVTKRGK
jgi:hypothetical protein